MDIKNAGIVRVVEIDIPNDSFGRLRVVHPHSIFNNKQIRDSQPLWWDDQQVSGSGTTSTHNTSQASTTISVSNLTAGKRVRQTYQRMYYQPGKSQNIVMTGLFGPGVNGVTKRLGQFTDLNGLFFEQSGTTFQVVRRSRTSGTPTDFAIPQSAWNLDKLDGSGISGITLDITKVQIFVIDYQWLGAGEIKFGFFLDGRMTYCHRIFVANNLSTVYMSTPDLPLRVEISNDGSGTASSITHICSSVTSEGGVDATGMCLSASRGATKLTTLNDSDLYPLVSIRLKPGFFGTQIRMKQASVITGGNTTLYEATVLFNPTIIGTPLSFTGIANSAIEADVSATNTTKVTGGIRMHTSYKGPSRQGADPTIEIDEGTIMLGTSISDIPDTIVLAVRRITGTTESFWGSLEWEEML